MSSVIHKVVDAVTGGHSTVGHADSDMQDVLDALAALNGRPIEQLDVTAARAEPSPADAVMALLRKQGKDTSPRILVPEVTSVDRQIDGAAGRLEARIFTPQGAGPHADSVRRRTQL